MGIQWLKSWTIGIFALWMSCVNCQDPIRVTSILSPPFLMEKAPDNSSSADNSTDTKYEGFINSVLEGMARITGRTFEIHLVADGSYGMYKPDTKSATGMIGELFDDVADLAAAPLIVTVNREHAVDFLFPYDRSEASILMRRRHPSQTPVIKSLEDLVNQDEVDYGVLENGAIAEALETSKNPLHQVMWSNMTSKPYVFKESNQKGVTRARNDHQFVFIMEGSLADYAASKPPCDLEVIRAGFYNRQYAFAVQNQSPLRDILNEAQVTLQSNGEMDAYIQQWFGDNECANTGSRLLGGSLFVSMVIVALQRIL